MTTPILVTGGTGKSGRRVAALLAARGQAIRIGSRSGHPAFDWDDPRTWEPALDGVAAVYLCFAPDLSFPGAADSVGGVAAAAASGAWGPPPTAAGTIGGRR